LLHAFRWIPVCWSSWNTGTRCWYLMKQYNFEFLVYISN
jgi:hypothetical protein